MNDGRIDGAVRGAPVPFRGDGALSGLRFLHRFALNPAALLVFVVFFLLLLLASAAGWRSAALAALAMLGLAYWPAALVLHRGPKGPELAEALIYWASGWTVLALSGLLLSAFGQHPGWAPLPLAVVALVGVVLRLRTAGATAASPEVAVPRWQLFLGLLLLSVAFGHFIVADVRMGGGAFPAVLYNVDSAYHLGLVHGLLRDAGFPPESLSSAGDHRIYHYGALAMAAAVSRLADVPAHAALFLGVQPVLFAGTAAAVWLIAREQRGSAPLVLAIALLVIAARAQPDLDQPYVGLYKLAAWLANGDSVRFRTDYAGPGLASTTTVYGIFAAVVFIWCLGRPERFERSALMVLVLGPLIEFKATYYFALGAGLGVWSLWRAAAERTAVPLVAPILALSMSVAIYLSLTVGAGSAELSIDPFSAQLVRRLGRDLPGLMPLALPAVAALLCARFGVGKETWRWVTFALVPIALLLVLRLEMRDEGSENSAVFSQLAGVIPPFLGLTALAVAGRGWPHLAPWGRWVVCGVVALVAIPRFLVWTGEIVRLSLDATTGHEYVDNRSLGAALASIPLSGLVVTNDLRYPAEGWERENRAMQFPALFGHRNFFVNPYYERYYADVEERRGAVALLRRERWDPAILELARRYGWTHFVVHRDYPHPRDIPLPLVHDGIQYRVYRFPG